MHCFSVRSAYGRRASVVPAERERFHNVELGLEHTRLMIAAIASGTTGSGEAGERLMAFRRRIAPRNVLNVYFKSHKEVRYGIYRKAGGRR